MKIKICGMRESDNIEAVAQYAPDYMGFIFFKNSSRYVSSLNIKLLQSLPKNLNKTGVFVDERIELVLETVNQYDLQAVQLHGQESVSYCEHLRKMNSKIQIIKAFAIFENFNFIQLEAYLPVCDFFLFDTGGKLNGGNGFAFEWEILEEYTLPKPFWLSGGLDSLEAERLVQSGLKLPFLYGLDGNSRLEIEPGLKDPIKVASFIKLRNKLSAWKLNTI